MFDSGFGGLTVARAVFDLLPAEDLVYIGDTGRYPYGPRPRPRSGSSPASWRGAWSRTSMPRPSSWPATPRPRPASASSRPSCPVPVFEVIEPGARALVQATRSGRVGVIGTVGTVSSGAYARAVEATGADVALTAAACPGFVEFVERGETDGEQVTILAERLLAPVRAADVDTLLLGCTHYPFLARVISDVMGPEVVLVSSADETAFALRGELERRQLLRTPERDRPAVHRFLSSGDVAWFADLGRRLLGPELAHAGRWAPLDAPGQTDTPSDGPRRRPPPADPTAAPARPKEHHDPSRRPRSPTSCAPSASSGTSPPRPAVPCWWRSAPPGCCARPASTTTCLAG